MVRDGHAERVADLTVAMGTSLGFSRHELGQLETAALLHHLGQVCLDEPDDGRPPEPVSVAQAGATILRGTQLLAPAGDIIAAEWMPYREHAQLAPVGDVGADPQGRERLRRAVRRSSGTVWPRARSPLLGARVPLRHAGARSARSRARPARARSTISSAEARPAAARRVAGGVGSLRRHRSTIPSPITMSPIENCWLGNPGTVITSPRNPSTSSSPLRPVLHRLLDRHVHLAAVALAHVVLRRHPLVQRDDEHVERDAHRDERHALDLAVHEAEPEDHRVRQEQDPDADVFDPVLREVDELERDLDRQRRPTTARARVKWSEPRRWKLPFVATTTIRASAIVATKKITRTTVPTPVRAPQVSSG